MTCKCNCVVGGDTLKNHQTLTENARLLTENITLRRELAEARQEIADGKRCAKQVELRQGTKFGSPLEDAIRTLPPITLKDLE